ncbi:hypothetical protein DY000_02060828 [Brassica cretica]|uniref:Uncharacterized protein n=2 Tax=Brassica cretica TaxID=69181 RepID=A0ABQ7B0J0_BRACR|nr:hypothetical protein DY000_02060828 [Brassica cretica]
MFKIGVAVTPELRDKGEAYAKSFIDSVNKWMTKVDIGNCFVASSQSHPNRIWSPEEDELISSADRWLASVDRWLASIDRCPLQTEGTKAVLQPNQLKSLFWVLGTLWIRFLLHVWKEKGYVSLYLVSSLQENNIDTEEKNRRNFVGITLFRRHTDETSPRNFFFPRNSVGNIRRNSEETHFRGNSEEHQFVGNLLGIYRRSTSSGYTSIDAFLDIYPSIDPFIKTRAEYTEGHLSSEYSEEHVPRYIPRNISLGIFRGISPSVIYSDMKREKKNSMFKIGVAVTPELRDKGEAYAKSFIDSVNKWMTKVDIGNCFVASSQSHPNGIWSPEVKLMTNNKC